MESYFIKDTNKQYSIREDGTVIRHFKLNFKSSTIKYYKDEVVHSHKQINRHYIYAYINRKRVFINSLLREYFDRVICRQCSNIFKPIMKSDCVCPTCLISNRQINRKHPIKSITRAYVAQMLKINVEDLPDDLYKLKKITIKTKRLLWQKQKTTQN